MRIHRETSRGEEQAWVGIQVSVSGEQADENQPG